MKRFLRRTILGLVPVALAVLVLGVPTAAPDLGLQDVNLSCNDGTDLALALDVPTVLQLSDAVGAINLYPAGDPALTCSLTQAGALTRTFASSSTSRRSSIRRSSIRRSWSSGNPNYDYAVGGGQASLPCSSGIGKQSFSLNARVENDTPPTPPQPTAQGTWNTTIGTQQSQGDCFPGHLVTKIDCVVVPAPGGPPGSAQATAVITKATGGFAGLTGFEVRLDILDSGAPGGAGDMLAGWFASGPCDFPFYAPFPIDRGNINVHDAP
jgi:hypothetical protein